MHIFFRCFLGVILLASCGASPAPEFFGAQRTDITRNGRQYVIYQKGKRVEIIRLGYARKNEHAHIIDTMVGLIPEVTGCKLIPRTLRGDSGEMRGSLSCRK